MRKYINKKNIFNLIVFIVYMLLVLIVASKHEYWADEAQSWLLARDASIYELFTKYLHAEGHPMLWHLVLKSFQLFGWKYEDFNIISIIFSSLGVFLFLFKSNFKWYLKMLFPFTYFVFFQYTVSPRGYCLILFLLCSLAIIWDKRKEHYLLFTVLLILLINLEVYTMLFAGSIYLLEIIDYIKNRKEYKKDILYYLIVLFFIFLITSIYPMPLPGYSFVSKKGFIYYLSNSFFSSSFEKNKLLINSIFDYIIFLLISFSYIFDKKKKELVELIIIILPVYLFMSLIYTSQWHVGIIFLIFIFVFWIHKLSNNKAIIFLLLISFISQIGWSVKTSLYDYNNTYSPTNDVANYIKQYDYENLKIYGVSYYEVGVSSYFENKILDNWDETFFYFDFSNSLYHQKYNTKKLVDNNVDIIITTPRYGILMDNEIDKYYDKLSFFGSYNFVSSVFVDVETDVYVRKGLSKKN